jgi:hypothetical protein
MSNNEQTHATPRAYGESIIPELVTKYAAHKLAEAMVENKIDQTEGGTPFDEEAVRFELGRLMFLKLFFRPQFPHREMVLGAILPPIFDTPRMADAIIPGPDGADSRKMARRVVAGGIGIMHELTGVYVHELSHRAAGESFGDKGRVAVVVMPTLAQIGDQGYGVALSITGGRCVFKNGEFTPHQQAVIAVAGHMGDKLCFSTLGPESLVDVDFWLKRFADIHAAGDPDETKDTGGAAYHSGSYNDACCLYLNAPAEEMRRAAIIEAGRIVVANATDILAEATLRVLEHLKTMGDVVNLMTTAMDLSEAAALGHYGNATVTNNDEPSDEGEAE